MSTQRLVEKVLQCKNRREIERLLKKHRLPISKSKYC